MFSDATYAGGFRDSMSFAAGQPTQQQQQQQLQSRPQQQQQQQQQQTAGQMMGGGFGAAGNGFDGATSASASLGVVAGGEGWPPVSPGDMARYHQRFQQADTDGDGKLSGGEVVPVLMSLDAPKEVLKDIWRGCPFNSHLDLRLSLPSLVCFISQHQKRNVWNCINHLFITRLSVKSREYKRVSGRP